MSGRRSSSSTPGQSAADEADELARESAARAPRRKWREAEFRIIPPHGSSGTAASITFQLPPKYKRIVELLYSHPDTPWKTESDVGRACMDYALHHFAAAIGSKVIVGIQKELDMMNALIVSAREQNDFAATIDAVQREVQRLENNGMRRSAVKLAYDYRESARRLSDPNLAKKLVEESDIRFKHLLTGRQGRKDTDRVEDVHLRTAVDEPEEDEE